MVSVDQAVSVTTGRRGDIQGLRALAVLLVVVYHTEISLPGGYVGVDVFFVISGYVITRMLWNEMESTGGIGLKQFYLRRIRRILPALGLMLVAVMLASVVLAPWGGQSITARTGVAAALFNANNFLIRFGGGGYFDVDADVNALLHTWSLSVEEQFYMVFPALLLGAWLLGRRMSRIGPQRMTAIVLTAIVVFSFLLSWVLTAGDFGQGRVGQAAKEFAFFSSVTRAWEFAAGGLLVVVSGRLSRIDWRFGTALSAGGVAMLAWASFGLDDFTPFPGLAALIPVAGTILLIVGGESAGRNPITAVLATRPSQWLGDISYSWYLWHWPMIVFAVALFPDTTGASEAAAALSLVPAVVSYRFVENPIRFKKHARPKRTMALAGICIVTPLIAGAALLVGHRVLSKTDTFREVDQASQFHADKQNGCTNSTPIAKRTKPACTWRAESSIGHAVLVGDSNAGQFTEGFTAAMNSAGYDATVATKASCPFVDLVLIQRGVRDTRCRNFVAQSIDDLVAMKPDLVVLAAASDRYVGTSEFTLRDPSSSERARTVDAKQAMWATALERTIARLEDAGIDVAVIHPIPKFPSWDPLGCAVATWLVDDESCGATRSIADMQETRRTAVLAESAAIANTGATEFDFFDVLCPSDPCSTRSNAVWMWRDGSHISVVASRGLESMFATLVEG